MNRRQPPTWSGKVELYRWLYSLLLYLLTPLQLLRLWRKGNALPAYRWRWGERFAHLPSLPRKPRIWLHSVSVGETIAAAPLVERLMAAYPDHSMLVTTTTPTGSEQVRRLFADRVEHFYFPYDLPHVVSRFLDKTRPNVLVLMETELWPNLLRECHRRFIPVLVVNARLSPSSLKGDLRVQGLIAPFLSTVSRVAAQSAADAERFLELGAPAEQVAVCGNIKSDIRISIDVLAQGQNLRDELGHQRPIWIAASTHAGEETQMLDAHRALLQQFQDALLILVPRHPERFDEVAALCDSRAMSTVRRSSGQSVTSETTIYLADSMGELLKLYAAADLSFIGGSLVNVGGHNPLEPAALAKPVITGPQVFNFADVYSEMLERGAAITVTSSDELAERLIEGFSDPSLVTEAGQLGLAMVEETRGAVDCLFNLADSALGGHSASSGALE